MTFRWSILLLMLSDLVVLLSRLMAAPLESSSSHGYWFWSSAQRITAAAAATIAAVAAATRSLVRRMAWESRSPTQALCESVQVPVFRATSAPGNVSLLLPGQDLLTCCCKAPLQYSGYAAPLLNGAHS